MHNFFQVKLILYDFYPGMMFMDKEFHCFTESNNLLSLEKKFIGGKKVPPGCRKCMASFRHKSIHVFSAFLISEKHVITAAHCLNDFLTKPTIPDFSEYSVEVGLFDSSIGGIVYQLKEVEVHQYYNPLFYSPSHDFGLLTVNICLV